MKPLIAILHYQRHKILEEMLDSLSWCRERVIVFDDCSPSPLPNAPSGVIYKMATKRGGVAVNSNRAIKYFLEHKNFDVLFLLNDDLLIRDGAFQIYVDAIEKTGYDHFCHTDNRSSFKPSEEFTKKGVKLVRRITGDGCFMTITRRMCEVLGGFGVEYGLFGGEHYSFSRRAAAAGFCKDSLDVVGADKFITVRQYDDFNLPRSLSMKELMPATEIGNKTWLEEWDEDPVIFKEIVV